MPPSAGSSTVLFDQVLGHARQKERLLAALESGRLPHALLFAGPAGVGKRRVASALAQALLCSAGAGRPCGVCSGCMKVAADIHPAIVRVATDPKLSKSGEIVIEQINRAETGLNALLSRSPGEGGLRVVIMDDAERMNQYAQNAFLKTLEEPMGSTYFFLITANPDRLLPTIRSRCQTVRFGPLGITDTEDILMREDGVSPREASEYARLSQGSVEDALLLRDGGYREVVDAAFAVALLALAKHPVEWPAAGTGRDELVLTADALIRIYRDVLLRLAAGETRRLFFADRTADLDRLAAAYDADRVQELLEAVCRARARLLGHISPRLAAAQLWTDLGIRFF